MTRIRERRGRRTRTASVPTVSALGLALGLAFAVRTASAQESGAFTVTPTFSISEALTDNRNLSATNKQAEATTTISPGVRISRRSARVQGSLDYSLNAIVHARDSSRNNVQNALSAAFNAEVIEQHAFVSASASISQQSISAFGVQTPSNSITDSNRTEVRTLSVSPSLRGRLGEFANLEARTTLSTTSNGSAQMASSNSMSTTLRAFGSRGPFGWSADASESSSDFDRGRKTKQGQSSLNLNYRLDVWWRADFRATRETNDVITSQTQTRHSIGAGFTWTPNPDLSASLRATRESNDASPSGTGDRNSWEGGLDWAPLERTRISFNREQRFFGTSQRFSFQHRMARSVWSYSDTRDISTNATGNPGTGVVSSYDLLFAQFAVTIPDPIQRDLFVRAVLGIPQGFLTNAVTLRHSQSATVLLQGVRTNISLSAFATDSRRLDSVSTAEDDLSRFGNVRQHGHSITVSYQLAPNTSANFGYNQTATAGSGTQSGNSQRSFTLSASTLLAQRASLSLSLRHVVFDSAAQPYTENGATAAFSIRF